jgi:hypothetical protein
MELFSVPSVARKPWGIVCLVLNVLPLPGVGSILAGVKGGHRGVLIVGIVQALLDIGGIVLLVNAQFLGFLLSLAAGVWSIVWGVRIFLASGATTSASTPTATVSATTTATKARKSKAKKA